jgi:hypothetical protein
MHFGRVACKALLFPRMLKSYANHAFHLAIHFNHLYLKQDRNCNKSKNMHFVGVPCKTLLFQRMLKSYANHALTGLYSASHKKMLDFERSQKIVSRLLNGRMATGRALPYHSFFYEVYEKSIKKFNSGTCNLSVMQVVHALPMTIQRFSVELQADLTHKSK